MEHVAAVSQWRSRSLRQQQARIRVKRLMIDALQIEIRIVRSENMKWRAWWAWLSEDHHHDGVRGAGQGKLVTPPAAAAAAAAAATATQTTTAPSGRGIDYSRWEHLHCSSDEEEESGAYSLDEAEAYWCQDLDGEEEEEEKEDEEEKIDDAKLQVEERQEQAEESGL